MDMATHVVLHVGFHAATMGLMVLPGMAAAGVAMTPGNVLAATFDMTASVFEGVGFVGDVGTSATGVPYEWGMMDHSGAAHDMAAGVAGHGAHGGSELSSLFADHGAHGADASCGLDEMSAWEQSEPSMDVIDEEIAGGTYDSRADYFSEFCHDHS